MASHKKEAAIDMTSVIQIEDLGLPAKFTGWRRGQAEMVERILSSEKRFSAVCAATGAGKSLIYFAVASAIGRTCVLTSTKALQDQLAAEFKEMGLADMRGMNNYLCAKTEEGELPFFRGSDPVYCDEGPCHAGYQCDLKGMGCEYFDRKRSASEARLVVTNYDYWLRVQNQGDPDRTGLGHFDLLVCDEAHNADQELADYLTVEIGAAEMEELTDQELPQDKEEGFGFWKSWTGKAHQTLLEAISSLLDERGEPSREAARHLKALKSLRDRLHTVMASQGRWVAEEYRDRRGSRKVRFAPVDVVSYSGDLFQDAGKVLLVSATVRPKTMEILGIPLDESDFLESPYSFDPARRPVIHIPTIRVNHGVTLDQMKWWVNRIDQIVDRRLDRQGILHTVSYQRARFFMEHTRHRDIAWLPEGRDLRDAVAHFKTGNGHRKLLVSPALTTGYDFPGESVRYQIIGKIPFPDTRSKLLQTREEIDKDYGPYVAMQALVQMAGRAVRSEDDFAECFVIDDHFFWFWKRYRHFAPAWFGKAVRTSQTVPDAMEAR